MRAVRKKATTLTVNKGTSPSEVSNSSCRHAPDFPILSLRSYFWALSKDEDMEKSCRAILLERDVKGCEAFGKSIILYKFKGLKGRAAQLLYCSVLYSVL